MIKSKFKKNVFAQKFKIKNKYLFSYTNNLLK